jgi:hypothetical protein
MPWIRTRTLGRLVASALFVGSVCVRAQADPILVQGYTLTDLGAGSPTFATDASGNEIVITPDGHTGYAFPQIGKTSFSGVSGQGVLAKIPLLDPPPTNSPDTYGNPANAFAYIQSAVMNAKGMAAVLEVTGVAGHWYQGDTYYVQENANGSWGTPVRIFSGPTDFDGSAQNSHASVQQLGISIAGINNLGQVLGFLQTGPQSWQSGPFVYNINTQTSVQLGNLNGNYLNVQPTAIADNRELLLQGQPVATGGPDHTLLLSPDGSPPTPFAITPEPSGWAVMALAAVAFAVRQHRQNRRSTRSRGKRADPDRG